MILDQNKLSEISEYLQAHGVIKSHEFVSKAEKPGEGNMNYTLRLFVDEKTFIIKQARPYVEKYPSIAAPEERILVESEFYKIISKNDFLAHHTPKILHSDEKNHILLMEDLGNTQDFSSLYKKGNELIVDDVKMCAVFLNELHGEFKKDTANDLMANKKLRNLNHEHIFIYPFLEDNGFDLDTVTAGLQNLAMNYKTNSVLKAKAEKLGANYLADGDTLLHGDYYPGSWLNTKEGLKVIDPEFAFYGKAEFDLGVLNAHLMMAQQPENVFETLKKFYKKDDDFEESLFKQFTGIEIMRRIIGLAQLPLDLSLEEKKQLLEKAMVLIGE
ncbi:phosphotransferase [Pedobacter sp. SD-b]|uniref:Phosphotransferase n=1 Tax=Pedobacter segetis TaxID=2793069 RepID=A0ABS1BNR3_9SPHI|nr:phosphotransferase [Pedobacter segetis]MBK0383844.1 phosphotransferase [Pedobacter segetis]